MFACCSTYYIRRRDALRAMQSQNCLDNFVPNGCYFDLCRFQSHSICAIEQSTHMPFGLERRRIT